MNTTDEDIINGDLIPAEKPLRITAGLLDEHYIDIYLDNPSNKTEALRKAAKIAGVYCDVSRQRAREIHRRLQHRIESGLVRRMMEGATLGYGVLYKMTADENTSEAVRAKCASLLIEYAGKSKPDLNPNSNRNRANIKEEIKQTQIRIAQLTGESL